MHEYFCFLWNIIYKVISNPDVLESYCNIISDILVGVVAIIGVGCLKPLKDKTLSATFNFWSQLRVRLLTIKKWLEQDCGLLDNLYSPESKININILTPEDTRIMEFKKNVQSTLEFIENSNDQMPAYIGWSKDYSQMIAYLEDMIVYDIGDPRRFFKFQHQITESDRKKYRDEICTTIFKICHGIEEKQNQIEKRLCEKRKARK